MRSWDVLDLVLFITIVILLLLPFYWLGLMAWLFSGFDLDRECPAPCQVDSHYHRLVPSTFPDFPFHDNHTRRT